MSKAERKERVLSPKASMMRMVTRNVCADIVRLLIDQQDTWLPQPPYGQPSSIEDFERQVAEDLLRQHMLSARKLWNNYIPSEKKVADLPPLEFRKCMIAHMRDCFEQSYDELADERIQGFIRNATRTQPVHADKEWVEHYYEAGEKGAARAYQMISGVYDDLATDCPGLQRLSHGASAQDDAVVTSQYLVTECFTRMTLQSDLNNREAMFRACVLTHGISFINRAIGLALDGRDEAVPNPPGRPLRIAGAILTHLGITQMLDDNHPLEAQSVQAVQMRELMQAIDTIGNSLLPHLERDADQLQDGLYYSAVKQYFFCMDDPEPKGGYSVSKRLQERGTTKATRMFNDITGKLCYLVRSLDGYAEPEQAHNHIERVHKIPAEPVRSAAQLLH